MENAERSDTDGASGESTAPKPLYKLYVHSSSFSTEDLIIRSDDFPDVQVGDVLEIYHEEDTFSRLLLQVHQESLVSEGNMTKNSPKKNTVFIDKSIADSFCLTNFKDVIVNKVDPEIVSLDSVELTFKDQYLGRSEMWRLKKSMVNSVVYLNKKVCFCKGSIRCTVNEMWGQGDRVACGLVTMDTKVVFRSTTAMVYLFIQMSSEMWDFDIHGDLYFEKAVNGFLYEMFSKWKEKESAHEVTIVLFSRTFYDAQDLSEFPEHMQDCLQQDYGGRFYEDFYRVAVQNERFEDWFPTLTLLRQSFTHYKELVLDYHTRPGISIPKATNSTAAQGNFLEVLNISLNTFENSHINRNLDRTGQQAIVITPGVGIFEVDRDLTVITKQRIIDSGVGSDLICVGEQPLHAVPLFKMHTKGRYQKHSHDFSMPHWINLSFYTTNKKVGYSTFIPRIKLPPLKDNIPSGISGLGQNNISGVMTCIFPDSVADSALPDSPFAYDEYDAKIFQLPPAANHGKAAVQTHRAVSRQKSKNSVISVGSTDSPVKKLGPFKVTESVTPSGLKHSTPTKMSKPVDDSRRINWNVGSQEDSFFKDESGFNRGRKASSAIFIPSSRESRGRVTLDDSDKKEYYSKSFGGKFNTTDENTGMSLSNHFKSEEKTEDPSEMPDKPIFGSAGSHFNHAHNKNMLMRPNRALVNPFDPSQVTEKLTSNRRRWTHIFPKIPACNHQTVHNGTNDSSSYTPPPLDSTHSTITSARTGDIQAGAGVAGSLLKRISDVSASTVGGASEKFASQDKLASRCPRNRSISNCELKLGNFMWGATGEQSWDATTATGVDWKSIIFPASLPVTTDFMPELRSLQNDYVVSDYDLVPDDVNADYVSHSPLQKPPLTTREVFLELISQRLAHGFQLIIAPKDDNGHDLGVLSPGAIVPSMNTSFIQNQKISLVKPLLKQVLVEEFWLSIGRIFHHITLTGSVIKVMIYRPRHPYPTLDYHYRYRFMAPDNDTYDISWVEFNMEKLENYNWNYLDNYVCTRGDQEFAMTEGQKYWRFRMYALPLNPFVQMTKKLMDGPPDMRCDIYENPSHEDDVNLVAGFLKFVETCLNKIRRPVSACTSDNAYRQRKIRSNTMAGELKPPGPMARSMFRERLGSNKGMERGRDRAVSGPPIKAVERSRTESGSNREGGEPLKPLAQSVATLETSGSQDSVFGTSGNTSSATSLENQEHKDFKLLRNTCTVAEILEAMKNPNTGLTFVSKQTVLPATTFVSAEGVLWLMEHVEGVHSEGKAINIMDEMMAKGMICHASGDPRQKFVYGFYLFFLLISEKEQPVMSQYGRDLESFQNDWIEVELKFSRPITSKDDENDLLAPSGGGGDDFLEYNLRRFSGNEHVVNRKKGRPPFRHFTVDVDPSPSTKSERPEWGSGKYQVSFRPDQAFEMVLKWSVATGALVSELISNWSRKSQQNGLSIIPIPCDPFALPSQNSDPIRGPIFVELDTECLMEEKSHLFEEFPEETREQRLFLFRESIVKRFGFVACSTDPNHQKSSATFSTQHQYIHSTGNMFVLIPTRLQLQAGILGMKTLKKRSLARAECSPGESPRSRHSPSEASRQTGSDVITRNVTGNTKVTYEHHETGFLWAWNFMISKRWKTQSTTGATGDIPFMDKMLADFRRFCRNEDNRLKQYWLDCWTQSSSNQERFY